MNIKRIAVYPGTKIKINICPHNPNSIPTKTETKKISSTTSFDILWPGEIPNTSGYNDLNYNYQFYHPNALIWLKNIIENNTNKKIFVFSHHFLPHKCGNCPDMPSQSSSIYTYSDIYPNDNLTNVSGDSEHQYCRGANALSGMEFYFLNKLNNDHKNVIFFSGHSHFTWSNMNDNDTDGISDVSSNKFKNCHIDNNDYNIFKPSDYYSLSVHNKNIYTKSSRTPKSSSGYWVSLPSLSKPININYSENKYLIDNKNTLRTNADITIMDVYQNGVKIKGYSLVRTSSSQKDNVASTYATYADYNLNSPLIEKDLLLTGNNLGSYSYSVGLLSDLHIDKDNNDLDIATDSDSNDLWYDGDDLIKALNIFKNEYRNMPNGHEISFICGCGDITESYITAKGWYESDTNEFYNIFNSNHGNLKFYTPLGNHDFMGIFNKRGEENTESAYETGLNNRINIWHNKVQCFAGTNVNYFKYNDTTENNRSKLSYYFEYNGDIYVILSVDYGNDMWAATASFHDRMVKPRQIIDANSSDTYIQQIKQYISDTDYSEIGTTINNSSNDLFMYWHFSSSFDMSPNSKIRFELSNEPNTFVYAYKINACQADSVNNGVVTRNNKYGSRKSYSFAGLLWFKGEIDNSVRYLVSAVDTDKAAYGDRVKFDFGNGLVKYFLSGINGGRDIVNDNYKSKLIQPYNNVISLTSSTLNTKINKNVRVYTYVNGIEKYYTGEIIEIAYYDNSDGGAGKLSTITSDQNNLYLKNGTSKNNGVMYYVSITDTTLHQE